MKRREEATVHPERSGRAADAESKGARTSDSRPASTPALRASAQRERFLGSTLGICCTACSVSHVAPYVPKHREYEVPAAQATAATTAPGSLFMAGQGAAGLFTDQRAYRVNDLVVVKVEEIADAQRKANTDIKRDSGFNVDVSMFLKAINAAGVTAAIPALDAKVGLGTGTTFDATGATGRTEHLQANVPAIVRKVLPNGNLFVEGHRVVLVNQEENHFYISGVVRPIDIDQANTVKSNLMADAEVEFTGRGVISDNQHQGWLSRFFGWIWPF